MTVMNELKNHSRVLVEADLKPVQGTRFQPTGFPDLGAATYTTPSGKEMLLVESVQSMANRLEEVCWNDIEAKLVPELEGLPYVAVFDQNGREITNSILESHRVNSPYILEGDDKSFFEMLQSELSVLSKGRVDLKHFAEVLFRYDPNSLIHGVFLAKKELAGGRLRLPRVLSSFVEASDVAIAPSGGVKLDGVDPSGETKKGFGHVPFARDEFTAGRITAYFNIDIEQIRGYGLPEKAQELLVNIVLFKVRKFLSGGIRLRTACDLETTGEPVVKSPEGFSLPSLASLSGSIGSLINQCGDMFAQPRVTTVSYNLEK